MCVFICRRILFLFFGLYLLYCGLLYRYVLHILYNMGILINDRYYYKINKCTLQMKNKKNEQKTFNKYKNNCFKSYTLFLHIHNQPSRCVISLFTFVCFVFIYILFASCLLFFSVFLLFTSLSRFSIYI